MSESSEVSWFDNPNGPKIPSWLYTVEKIYFAGSLIGAVLYGVVIVVFLQCMGALLDPVNRAMGGIKWGLVVHTVAMFALVTIYTAVTLNTQSISSFVDNRDFRGTITDAAIPPGPIGYQWSTYYDAITIVPGVLFVMNIWLVDGLLLYRCYVVYAMSYRAIAIPCIMYFGCIGTGILFIHQVSRRETIVLTFDTLIQFGAPYLSVSFSLNILLTLMITIRLALHRSNIRDAMDATAGAGGLYKAIVTVFIESSALWVFGFVSYVIPWAAKSFYQQIFLQVAAQTQSRKPESVGGKYHPLRECRFDTFRQSRETIR